MKGILLKITSVLICLLFVMSMASASSLLDYEQNKNQPEKLESVLYQLTQAQNPDEFAEKHGIYLENGKVRVVIELKNETATIPGGYGIIEESRHENLVQALVPMDKLITLAEDLGIVYLRTPLKPAPADRISISEISLFTIIALLAIVLVCVIYVTRRKQR